MTPLPSLLARLASMVALEHTVFALPFALSALLLALPFASPPLLYPPLLTVLWVLLAMLGGRTFAMGLNRIADARYDALNPRTAQRELPSGQVSSVQAWLLTLGSLGLLVLATLQLPPMCLQWLPVALLALGLYSYTKRFTVLCHAVLGICLGGSAVAGWMALLGDVSGGLPLWLGASVALWVAGFDILYACQDVTFDREQGLHSIPAWLGIQQALWVSRGLHALCFVALVLFLWLYHVAQPQLGLYGWSLATVWMGASLVQQHALVQHDNLTQINKAFFTLNGRISLSLFAGIGVDALAHALRWY